MSSILKDIKNCSTNRFKIMHISGPKLDNIIDSMHPDVRNQDKFKMLSNRRLLMPFFLQSSLRDLDINQTYLLYCDNGAMIHMQALTMYRLGFKSVALLSINSVFGEFIQGDFFLHRDSKLAIFRGLFQAKFHKQ